MFIADLLIEKLAKGEIQVKHTKKPEDEKLLNVIISLAFPEDLAPGGNYTYYFKDFKGKRNWYHYSNRPKKGLEIVELAEFFKSQEVKINLNDEIQAELTPYGIDVFRTYAVEKSADGHSTDFSEELNDDVFDTYTQNILENKFTGQLHLFMDVFGKHINNNVGTMFDVLKSFDVLIDRRNTTL